MQEHIQIIFSRGNILGLAASLFKRDTILKYPFDFRFPLQDDGDLRRRLTKDGYILGISSALAYHYHKADLRGFTRQRFVNGRGKAQRLWKHRQLNPLTWMPLNTVYMFGFCLIKGKPNLIPYFLLDGVITTTGMVKGFFELVGKALRKTNI